MRTYADVCGLVQVECSLLHVGRAVWLEGNMKGAVTILEALLVSLERHKRDLTQVHADVC